MYNKDGILTVLLGVLWLPFFLFGSDTNISLHPAVKLLDAHGVPVIQSGQPISTEKTCSACHDYEFITIHSYHAQQGKNEFFTDETRPKNFADFVLLPGMFAMSSL